MNNVNRNALEYLKSELKNLNIRLSSKSNGREGVDFLIGDSQLYLQSIDLDTTQRSIKIAKQDLGELRDKLFVALILIFLFLSIKNIINF
jgi:hypothetical protein